VLDKYYIFTGYPGTDFAPFPEREEAEDAISVAREALRQIELRIRSV
jgi:hypothetical protein